MNRFLIFFFHLLVQFCNAMDGLKLQYSNQIFYNLMIDKLENWYVIFNKASHYQILAYI